MTEQPYTGCPTHIPSFVDRGDGEFILTSDAMLDQVVQQSRTDDQEWRRQEFLALAVAMVAHGVDRVEDLARRCAHYGHYSMRQPLP